MRIEAAAADAPAGVNPATASLYIANPLSGAEGLLQLFSTHPRVSDRVRRLRAMAGARFRPAA